MTQNIIDGRVFDTPLRLFNHPLARPTIVRYCVFKVPVSEPCAISIEDYSMFGRFLFTEFTGHLIQYCRVVVEGPR